MTRWIISTPAALQLSARCRHMMRIRFQALRLIATSSRRVSSSFICVQVVNVTGPSFRFLHCTKTLAMATKKTADYGSWVSPITSDLLTKERVSFQTPLHVDPVNLDTVYWAESRPSEKGRYVICSWKEGDANFTSWTPDGFNARTRVHEYGGGNFTVYDGVLYFSNFTDQRLYKQTAPTSSPEPVTPAENWRYADTQLVRKNGDFVFAIREDHSVVDRKESTEAENSVVVINLSTQQQTVLARGADFYSNPRVSPDGKKICWVQWHHPNMPWDNTELWQADLANDLSGIVGSPQQVIGGQTVSVIEPRWAGDNSLLYIGDQTAWWNLYHVPAGGRHVNLAARDVEVGGPGWVFGKTSYALNPSQSSLGKIATLYGGKLQILDVSSGQSQDVDTGYANNTYVQHGRNNVLYLVAGSPNKAQAIIRVETDTGKVKVIRESTPIQHSLDSGYFSIPEEVVYNSGNGEKAYAYYYPPQNKDYQGPSGSLPPLLVKVHGGPTSQTSPVMNLQYNYFTSRGFGILDLNYRGSTGYGRPYRTRLYLNWGITDIEDAAFGALHMASVGRADRNKLCIDGGSAGGYTTLACLAFKPDVFKAASSSYGVADLELLTAETHKFESRYLDNLIGPYPQDKQVYVDRSPIYHTDNIVSPCIFFQGDEDKVVPPNQAEMMFNSLKAKGITTAYVLFKGEQHGFREAANIHTAIDGEFYFYSVVFGFNAPGISVSFPIENLPDKS